MRGRAICYVTAAAIVATTVTAAGCAGGEGAPAPTPEITRIAVTPDMLRLGRTSYRKYCIQCHGYGGKGDGTSSASFDPPPRDHTNAELMDPIDDATIAETIRFGGAERGFPNMPAFSHATDDEVVALVAYVRSLSRPQVERLDIEAAPAPDGQ